MIASLLRLIAGVTGFGAVGSAAVATGGLLAIVGTAWLGFAWHYEAKGAAKEVAKIEKATTHATTVIRSAAAKSADNGVRGVRDPSTKDE